MRPHGGRRSRLCRRGRPRGNSTELGHVAFEKWNHNPPLKVRKSRYLFCLRPITFSQVRADRRVVDEVIAERVTSNFIADDGSMEIEMRDYEDIPLVEDTEKKDKRIKDRKEKAKTQAASRS
jgi:hypothetical protein